MDGLRNFFEGLTALGSGMAQGDVATSMAELERARQARADVVMQQQLYQAQMAQAERERRRAEKERTAMAALAPQVAAQMGMPGATLPPSLVGPLLLAHQKAMAPTPAMRNINWYANLPEGPEKQAAAQSLGLGTPAPDFSTTSSLRKEYLSQSKPWQSVRDAYERIEASEPTGPGDISLLIGYMKLLDPESVVHEGEFATAENAGGVGEAVRGLYNRIVSGERLTDQQRNRFKTQSRALFSAQYRNQQRRESTYQGIAGGRGMDVGEAVPDVFGRWRGGIPEIPPYQAPGAATGTPSPSPEIQRKADQFMQEYLTSP